jgi:hypothetical protein
MKKYNGRILVEQAKKVFRGSRQGKYTIPSKKPGSHVFDNPVFQQLNYIVLEPIAKPNVEQIRVFRELGRPTCKNMLEMRQLLIQGGFTCFGELLDDQAKAISVRLSEVGVPHRIEKTPVREIHFYKGKKT